MAFSYCNLSVNVVLYKSENKKIAVNNMANKKLVMVINGRGGVGKDTLCEALKEDFVIRNVSAITPIKNIAKQYGWNGEKDDKSRRFLAELKRVFADYNDLPTKYLIDEYCEFLKTEEQILCVHIRENDQIAKFVSNVTTPCITMLVCRNIEEHGKDYGNAADDGVDNYDYDYIFDNNDSVEVSCINFRKLMNETFESMTK